MKKKYNKKTAFILLAIAMGLAFTRPQPGFGRQTTASDPNTVEKTQSSSAAQSDKTEQNTWEKYKIILQRNIFSRQRGPVRQKRVAQSRPIITRNPESYLILKGIVQEDGKFIAFVENSQSESVFKLYEGDSIARGIVKNFSLDSIEYQIEDKTISVTLGRDLEGGQGTLPMSRLLEMSVSSSTTSDQNSASEKQSLSEDETEILRKLMEQRKQQLGQ